MMNGSVCKESIQQDSKRMESDNNKKKDEVRTIKILACIRRAKKYEEYLKIRLSMGGINLQRIGLNLLNYRYRLQILGLNSYPDARLGKVACP